MIYLQKILRYVKQNPGIEDMLCSLPPSASSCSNEEPKTSHRQKNLIPDKSKGETHLQYVPLHMPSCLFTHPCPPPLTKATEAPCVKHLPVLEGDNVLKTEVAIHNGKLKRNRVDGFFSLGFLLLRTGEKVSLMLLKAWLNQNYCKHQYLFFDHCNEGDLFKHSWHICYICGPHSALGSCTSS